MLKKKKKVVKEGPNIMDKYRVLQKDFKKRRDNYWKLEKGDKSTIRILPPINEEDPFFHETRLHYITKELTEDGKAIGFICLEDKCAVCKLIKLLKTSDEDCGSVIEEIKTKSVFRMNIVDIGDIDAGTQVWRTYSEVIISELISFCADAEYGDITDIEEGRNITVSSTESSPPKFSAIPRPSVTPLDESFLDGRKDLSAMDKRIDRKEVKKLARYIAAQLGVEEDDDLADARQSIKNKKSSGLKNIKKGKKKKRG